MGRNVTFRVDEATLRKARVRAAERGISLSKLVEEMVIEELRRSEDDRRARGEA
jgi:predicted HicB family RNase H-like nuclease